MDFKISCTKKNRTRKGSERSAPFLFSAYVEVFQVRYLMFFCALARLKGFEPLTHGLEVRCSIRLSYRRIGLCDSWVVAQATRTAWINSRFCRYLSTPLLSLTDKELVASGQPQS